MERRGSLRVFVYGTLKRGERFHDRYCRGALSIVSATVRGRLSFLPAGYPVLDVPPEAILARGSADPAADAARLDDLERGLVTSGSWPEVAGELMPFDDPASRLPSLDRLEGYRPGAPSLYDRVALAVRVGNAGTRAAWVYVRGDRP
ncbi:MAG: gamma-glutamylcyclotransferase family protein [Candidatus Binatia bacterium]